MLVEAVSGRVGPGLVLLELLTEVVQVV